MKSWLLLAIHTSQVGAGMEFGGVAEACSFQRVVPPDDSR